MKKVTITFCLLFSISLCKAQTIDTEWGQIRNPFKTTLFALEIDETENKPKEDYTILATGRWLINNQITEIATIQIKDENNNIKDPLKLTAYPTIMETTNTPPDDIIEQSSFILNESRHWIIRIRSNKVLIWDETSPRFDNNLIEKHTITDNKIITSETKSKRKIEPQKKVPTEPKTKQKAH